MKGALRIFIIIVAAISGCEYCPAQQTNRTPINRGYLQANLDGNGMAITNVGTILTSNLVVNGVPIIGNGSGSTNVAHATNADIAISATNLLGTITGDKVTTAVANATTAANLSGNINASQINAGTANIDISGNATTATTADTATSVSASGITGTISTNNLPIDGSYLTNIIASLTTNQMIFTNLLPIAGGSTWSYTDFTIPNVDAYAAVSYNSHPDKPLYSGPPMSINNWPLGGNVTGTEYSFVHDVLNLVTNATFGLPLHGLGVDTVVIDGGWVSYRDANGNIHENTQMWPDGISNCVRWAHSLGIKVGLWTSLFNTTNTYLGYVQIWQKQETNNGVVMYIGNTNSTTQLNAGPSFSNDQLAIKDATTFANWGIDYFKDETGPLGSLTWDDVAHVKRLFVSTLNNLGHPYYMMSAVGDANKGQPWMKGIINAQRSGNHDMPNATVDTNRIFYTYCSNFWFCAPMQAFSGPGTYCSVDILPGKNTFTNLQNTMLIMSSMLSAELSFSQSFIGPGTDWSYLQKQIVDIDQDPRAIMAYNIASNANSDGSLTVWQKPLAGPTNTMAVAFFNTSSNTTATFTVTNMSLFGLATNAQMFCLDLVSNTTSLVSNNWGTLSIPPETAYGYKLMPLSASNAYNADGSGLTNLNAANIASGTLADARLSTNVPLMNGNQTFSGSNTFTGLVTITGPVSGNASGLTNILQQAFAWTNFSTPSGSGTNFILDGAGAINIEQNLTNDDCIVGITNTMVHYGLSLTISDVGATNHTFWFPTLWHVQAGTNLISATAGTNSGIVVTNGHFLSAVIKETGASRIATNTIIFLAQP